MNNSEIYKRLYKDYSKKYINKILISVFFGVLVAASTSAIAWLLDPAIKKIFVEKDQSLIFVIPLLIIIAFAVKGFALYFAKAIMIRVAEEVKKILQSQMVKSLINADTFVLKSVSIVPMSWFLINASSKCSTVTYSCFLFSASFTADSKISSKLSFASSI